MAQISGSTAFFDKTYNEALALTEQAYAYLSEIQHNRTSAESPTDELHLHCEAFRLTTRLMQVIAWLLTQRAIHAGELSAAEVAEGEQYRLGATHVCLDGDQHRHRAIPATMSDMLDRSLNLYIRVERLDGLVHHGIH